MHVVIRTFVESDKITLQSLMGELGYSLGEDDIVNNTDEIRQGGGEVFVAEFEGKVAGCLCSIIDTRLAAGKHGELVSLVVSDKYRGIGIGEKLVQHAEEWLSERVGKIRVRANTVRLEAHSFYNALGYKDIKTQKIFIKKI